MEESGKYRRFYLALSKLKLPRTNSVRVILQVFGCAEVVFKASQESLASIEGIGPDGGKAIKAFQDWEAVDQELESAKRLGVSIVTWEDASYPALLREIYDPPPLLYVKGSLDECSGNFIAVVGARSPTGYGRVIARTISRELAARGVVIVSGLARGIDSTAHEGAMEGQGKTIAVLGCGLDVGYPASNKSLMEKIAANGAVVTEFPLGTKPFASNFPVRNRIISGLSNGVLVVEAMERSGSLITARWAVEQNRNVYAVPGDVSSPLSWGSHKLIKQGAKLVENAGDILEDIVEGYHDEVEKEGDSAGREFERLCEDEKTIVGALGFAPRGVDELIEKTGIVDGLHIILLNLELKGFIVKLPGGGYARNKECHGR